MCRPEREPPDDESRGGGPVPHGKDHLPRGLSEPEGLRHTRTCPSVRGGAAGEGSERGTPAEGTGPPLHPEEHGRRGARARSVAGTGLSDRDAPHGLLHGLQRPHRKSLPEACFLRGHARIFHRRGIHRRDPLSARAKRTRIRRDAGARGPDGDRHHRHRRYRNQSLSRQGGHGRLCQAPARRQGRGENRGAGRALLPPDPLGAQAAHGLLACGPGDCPETGGKRPLHHGRRGTLFPGERDGLLQRRAALPPLRSECGTAHRPRLGLGALHDPGYPLHAAREQEPQPWPGAQRAV